MVAVAVGVAVVVVVVAEVRVEKQEEVEEGKKGRRFVCLFVSFSEYKLTVPLEPGPRRGLGVRGPEHDERGRDPCGGNGEDGRRDLRVGRRRGSDGHDGGRGRGRRSRPETQRQRGDGRGASRAREQRCAGDRDRGGHSCEGGRRREIEETRKGEREKTRWNDWFSSFTSFFFFVFPFYFTCPPPPPPAPS